MQPTNVIVFGDQTVEKRSSIQNLVRNSKTSAGARRLLQQATDLVQIHFGKLSKEDRAWDHEIETLLGLAEDNIAEDKPNGAIATVLMCIGRLAELVVHAEENPSILGSEKEPAQVLAFCTGLLPAAALVAARDTSELYDLAVEIISITLRLTLEMGRRLRMVEDSKGSWATTLVGKTPKRVQAILDDFHKSQSIPYAKRVAIGIESTGWLTLVGAPSSINRLMEFSKELDDTPKMKTDTNAAVHTEYMASYDIDKVLGSSPLLDIPITSKVRVLSPSSGKEYDHETLRSLLTEMLLDIAHKVLRIDDTIEAFVSGLPKDRSVALTLAGPTGHLPAVQKGLNSKKIQFKLQEHLSDKSLASRGGSDLIAIIGMSARLPGSNTPEDFFDSLLREECQVKRIPKSRFDLDKYYDATGKKGGHTTSAQKGAFLETPGLFDNRLFAISPREAAQMCPTQRMLLTTTYEALETAGYSKDGTIATQANRIAVYFGQAADDWREILNNEDIDIYYIPSLSRSFGPGRVAYHHKFGGGTYSLDSACATSTTAIHLACQALEARECDTALAGGGSLCVTPSTFAGLTKAGMVSEGHGCRTFHDDADGYARGEGVGMVVLKRLEDAVADNDNILGVIRGHGRAYTSTSTSITHPSAVSQARLYEDVLRQTSVIPNEIAYVEMHGTGTQAGDFEEMSSLIRVFDKDRAKNNLLTVGAVKANVGHGEAAAGVTSLIKVLMMLRERKIAPQPGMPFKVNRNFPKLDSVHMRIAGLGGKDNTLRASPASTDGKIKCLVSSFDASGGNTCLVVEEPPVPAEKVSNPIPAHVVTISAKTAGSLQQNRKNLLEYLLRNPQAKLADVAYTTTARRMHEVLRVAYTGKSTKDIIASLREDVNKNGANDPKKKAAPMNIGFAFTGQGSQYAGMGRQLYQHSSAFRDIIQSYEQMAQHLGFPSFLHLISDEKADIANASPVLVQLAIFALEISTAKLFKSWGVEPDVVIGHSLGEYAALFTAGVLSGSDALYLVGRRAQLMEQQLTPGQYAMLAVGKDVDATRQILAAESQSLPKTAVACINAPQVTVVSGPVEEIETLKAKLEKDGSRATVLRTAYGFHSHHLDPILAEFEKVANGVTFTAPTKAIASTLLGKVVEIGEADVFCANYLVRQARESVNFVGALKSYQPFTKAQTTWIEFGPDPVCIGLVRRTLDGLSNKQLLPTMKSSEDNWATIASSLAALYESGISVNWPQFHRTYQNSLTFLSLPTYAFDEKDYWKCHNPPTLALPASTEKQVEKAPAVPKAPAFSTTSLQWIEEEVIEGKNITVTFGAQTAEPKLYEVIQGHVVNGTTVVSMSLFCDMAQSAAQYAYQKLKPGKAPKMNLYDADMTSALTVPKKDPEQIVKTRVSYTLGERVAHVSWFSTKGATTTNHGDIKVAFEDNTAYFAQQGQTSFLVDARIEALKEMTATGKAHRLFKPVVYKLFGNVVDYSDPYKAMDEVWVDGQCRDAVATIKLPNTSDKGNFLYNPFYADGLIHLAGFLVNSGLKYPEDVVCISTGFESSRLLEEVRPDEVYTTYVSMVETESPNILSGSAYTFDSKKKLIQVGSGIRFQSLKRIVLTSILGGGVASRAAAPAAPVVAASLEKAVAFPKDLLSHKKLRPSTGTSTPATQMDGFAFSEQGDNSGASTPATSVGDLEGADDLFSQLLALVAAETGCTESDLEPSCAWADVGVDSLMCISIIATFTGQTGVELSHSFFLDNQTVSEARDALPGGKPMGGSPAMSVIGEEDEPAAPTVKFSEPLSVPEPESEPIGLGLTSVQIVEEVAAPAPAPVELPQAAPVEATKPSNATLLLGSPDSTGPKLFLLPDGSGSASRYVQLPSLGSSVNVYAVESPFVKVPAEFTCSVESMAASFLKAIQTVQPTGPYLLGGFSLGALYAYEITKMLGEQGEKVERLFIADMAVTKPLSGAEITQAKLSEAGLLPTVGRLMNAQKEHFVSTVRAMTAYNPSALSPSQQPTKTILVSSKTGLAAGKSSELAQWAKGSDDDTRGWANLVGAGSLEQQKVDVEHFSMFRHPTVQGLGNIWSQALSQL